MPTQTVRQIPISGMVRQAPLVKHLQLECCACTCCMWPSPEAVVRWRSSLASCPSAAPLFLVWQSAVPEALALGALMSAAFLWRSAPAGRGHVLCQAELGALPLQISLKAAALYAGRILQALRQRHHILSLFS